LMELILESTHYNRSLINTDDVNFLDIFNLKNYGY
jgi:hypothetical protein